MENNEDKGWIRSSNGATPAPQQTPQETFQRTNAPQSNNNGNVRSSGTTSLVLGIIGLLCCGIILGIPAIIVGKGNTDPLQQGNANAGIVLGWISIFLWIIAIVIYLSLFGFAIAALG